MPVPPATPGCPLLQAFSSPTLDLPFAIHLWSAEGVGCLRRILVVSGRAGVLWGRALELALGRGVTSVATRGSGGGWPAGQPFTSGTIEKNVRSSANQRTI